MKNVHRVLTVDHLFTYLCNNNFFANEYSSVSSAFSSSIFCRWSGRKLFIVVLETVVLCCSNGIAKRRLNVSSKTYCEIWNNECWMTNTPHQNDITIADLLIFCQSKVGHGCKITLCAGQHYSVSFVWGHWWLIVATNESQIWKHSRLSVDGQIAFTSGEFIQVDSVPIFAWSEQPLRFTISTINTIELTSVTLWQLFRSCLPAKTPVSCTLPCGSTLNVSELRQITHYRLPEQSYVKIPSLCGFTLILIQLLIDAASQFCPVCV